MRLRHLKVLRVALALAFLAPTAFLFLDFRSTGAGNMADGVLYLQFVPSLLSFAQGAALGSAGFLAVLVLTLLFGRVYCSTVCPFGTLQDAVSRAAGSRWLRTGKKRRRYAYSRPHTALRYATLALTVLLFAGGSGLLLNLLDPFSNFGRILTNLVRPVALAANNLAAPVAEQVGLHGLYRVRWPMAAPFSVGVALVALLAVGWLSTRRGRLYCNTLCPVGTLLGMVARHAVFRIRFAPGACTGCGRCERVCKAGCINFRNKTVDASRCVGCGNCLAACPEQALRLAPGGPAAGATACGEAATPDAGAINTDRRNLLMVLAAAGAGVAAAGAEAAPPPGFVQSRPTTIPEQRTGPVSPPGSYSVAQFTSRCTACHLCVAACPARILVPSVLDYGLSGVMQPRMAFASGHCGYECTVCSDICPSGAIVSVGRERKQRIQVGVAHFVRDNCVVHTDKTNCGACSEHCPTKAVHMVPYPSDTGRVLVIPEVNEALCVGCGACEHACPTRPFKAIYVRANARHKQAKKPVQKKLEQAPAPDGDFPF